MVHGRTVEYRHEHNGKSMDALNNLLTEFQWILQYNHTALQ